LLSEFLYQLHGVFSFFNVFRYITFRAALGALSAFLLCVFLMPGWISFVRRKGLGQVVRTDGPDHKHKAGTPTMGGLVGVGVAAICILMWAKPASYLVWLTLFGLLWFGGIGAVDDWLKLSRQHSRGLPALSKLFWQSVGAFGLLIFYLALAPGGISEASLIMLPFFKHPVGVTVIGFTFIAAFIMVGTSNAVNLTDGLDGLAAGCCAFAAAGLAVYAYLVGNRAFSAYLRILYVPDAGELAVVCAIIVGVCLGILWFNAYPAQVFMGDVGALGLGGAIGCVAVFIKAELVLLIFGGVFFLEALSVIFQVASFKLRKKRVLLMAPLHHHFEMSGMPESKVIVRFWIFSALLIIGMLSTLKLR